MKRPLLWVIAAVLVIAAGVAAYFLFLKPLIAPKTGAPTSQTGGATPPVVKAKPDDYNSAIDLYLAGPDDAPAAISRVELTLIKAEVTRNDKKTFKVFEGATRIVVQKGVTEKALNELMPAGAYGTLALTFLPTGAIVAADGSSQSAFLPNRVLTIDLTQEIPISRTLALLARLDLAASRFGLQSGVPTYILPATLTDESYVLGGIFRNSARIGDLWQIANPNLAEVVHQDLNLDIRPKSGLTGTPSFGAATASPNPTGASH